IWHSFFFSSRRRHTRCYRDWSSDVCSSDLWVSKRIETHLVTDRGDGIRGSYGHFRRPRGGIPPEAKRSVTHLRPIAPLAGATLRSEERRVGKEGRSRWWGWP